MGKTRCVVCKKIFNRINRATTCGKKCSVLRKKKYYNDNKENFKKYMKGFFIKNPEKQKEYTKRRIKNHLYEIKKYMKGWMKKNPQKLKKYAITENLKKYGLTIDDYDKILKQQKNKCAICNKDIKYFQRRFHVDHNHKTGKTRGLLCVNCNSGMGKLNDNIKILESAIKYLKRWKK